MLIKWPFAAEHIDTLLLLYSLPAASQDATLLMGLVRSLQLPKWRIALAVLLVDMSIIGPFAAEQPELWSRFCEQLLQQPDLYFLHEVVGAFAAAGSSVDSAAAAAAEEERA